MAEDHEPERWLALRLDDDVKEIHQELRTMRVEQNARFDAIDRELQAQGRQLQEHAAKLQERDSRFDSVVLDRLPEKPAG